MVKCSEEEDTWKSRHRSRKRAIRTMSRRRLQEERLTIAELLQADGSGGRGHSPDIWPSVVTRTGHGVELRQEASLSGAHKERYLFMEKCQISYL